MIRQFVVAALVGIALPACGVGADEDYATLGQGLDQGALATSQDPVPPPQSELTSVAAAADQAGNIEIITVSSEIPTGPGTENSSSQDPIPPKIWRPNPMHQFR